MYDPFVIESLFKKLIPKKLTDLYSAEVIERVRPYLNACVIKIQTEFFKKGLFNPDPKQPSTAMIMVAGGDAIRRYDHSVEMTSDIDTKVYYKKASKDVAQKIVEWLKDPTQLATVAEAQYKIATEIFSVERMRDNYLSLYSTKKQ